MEIPLDTATLGFVVRRHTELQARAFWLNPQDLAGLERLAATVHLARSTPFPVNLWQVQNLCAQKLNGTLSVVRAEAEKGKEAATTWIGHMTSLADNLDLRASG
jgi:hypothetical protein